MSTVLWANYLMDNMEVQSDESDKWALCEYSEWLDQLTKQENITAFSDFIDYTDFQFILNEEELPDGVDSTNTLMANNGIWQPAETAVTVLNRLLILLKENPSIFEGEKSHYEILIEELNESIEYAQKANQLGAKFNFSMIM